MTKKDVREYQNNEYKEQTKSDQRPMGIRSWDKEQPKKIATGGYDEEEDY